MDFLPSLLNFENLDDFQLHFPSLISPDDHQEIFQENIHLSASISSPPSLLLHDSPNDHNNNLVRKAETCKERQSSEVTFDQNEHLNNHNPDHQNKKRKLLHRNVERQRRQDMSKLYDSLQATLPSHCLKGKRSISDHMDESVKYIQLMQKKIEDLKKTRDKLKRMSANSSPVISPNGHKSAAGDECVTVNGCKESGMEITVNSPMRGGGGGGGEGHFRLSRILNFVIDQGLTILCCISSKANDRLIHTIQSEVSNGRSIDPTELQKRLRDLVSG